MIPASGFGPQYAGNLQKDYVPGYNPFSGQSGANNNANTKPSLSQLQNQIAYNNTGSVLAWNDTAGGGNTSSGNQQTLSGINPSDLVKSQQDALSANNQAELDKINTEYDRLSGDYEHAKTDAYNQYNTGLSQLDNSLSTINNQTNSAKNQAKLSTDNAIAEAGGTAQNVQRGNRNTLRALGILNSSFAGEKLSAPIEEFAKQRGALQDQYIQRINDLNDFYNQKVAETQTARQNLLGNYNAVLDKINSDMRFNEQQKQGAIDSLKAAFQNNLATINASVLNYQQAVQAAAQQAAMQLTQLMAYRNPGADLNAIYGQNLNNQLSGYGLGNQGINIYTNQKKLSQWKEE